MSRTTIKNVQYIVLNGSRTGLAKLAMRYLPSFGRMHLAVLSDTTEEVLFNIKENYPTTKSYYCYVPSDVADRTLFDANCPNIKLYDDFIDVSKH